MINSTVEKETKLKIVTNEKQGGSGRWGQMIGICLGPW
jgi:hypothetical protein